MSYLAESYCATEPAVRRHVIGIDGLDRLREIVAGAELEFHQLARGRLTSTLTRIVAGPVTFDTCRHSLPVRAMGRAGVDVMSFVLVRTPVVFNGMSLNAGDLVLYPPGSEFEGFSKGVFRDYIFTVRPDDLAKFAAAIDSEVDVGGVGRSAKLLCTAKESRRLATLAAALEGRGGRGLESPAKTVTGILTHLCDTLVSQHRPQQKTSKFDRQAAIVTIAERLLADDRDDERMLRSICQALDVSTRTLQLAFHSVVGIGPCEYGRLRRLNAARRDLLSGRSDGHVSNVALRHGFTHFGRFSEYYRKLFNESPSETLRRSQWR